MNQTNELSIQGMKYMNYLLSLKFNFVRVNHIKMEMRVE